MSCSRTAKGGRSAARRSLVPDQGEIQSSNSTKALRLVLHRDGVKGPIEGGIQSPTSKLLAAQLTRVKA